MSPSGAMSPHAPRGNDSGPVLIAASVLGTLTPTPAELPLLEAMAVDLPRLPTSDLPDVLRPAMIRMVMVVVST